jgi:hypothetical protein
VFHRQRLARHAVLGTAAAFLLAILAMGAPAHASGAVVGAASATTQTAGPTTTKIRNANNGKCLDRSGTDTGLVDPLGCNRSGRTDWLVQDIQVGAHQIMDTTGTQCLIMTSTANEARPVMGACGSTTWNDYWVVFWNADHTAFQLQNAYSSKCLVGRDSQTYPVQYDCGSWADQFWNANGV